VVEVFKTNVQDRYHATVLIDQIHNAFENYRANFDLEDCDRILRVQCFDGYMNTDFLINLLKNFGFLAEILPDNIEYSTATQSLSIPFAF
jgi:hypothetical protein